MAIGASVAVLLAGGVLARPAYAVAPTSCADLASAAIADTTISSATVVAAGTVISGTTVPVAICRVVGVVSTKPGEAIGIEVWLPTSGWNGRYEGTGSGGFGGSITYSELAAGVARGFATANTDTGHTGGAEGAIGQALPWAQNPVTLKDWGHTSIHLMTVSAKAISRLFYGQAAKFSYYDGCSTGGAEAMEEAEFYPRDFNGIHAGSPGMEYSHLMMSFLWGGLLPARDPAATLPAASLALLNDAVLQSCGGAQAVKDGFLLDPRSCQYNPSQLLCQPNQDPSTCLSAPQVAEARALYSPVLDPQTGLELYPGFVRGGESQWSDIQGALVPFFAQPLLANAVFDNPNWDWTTFNFDSDAILLDRKLSPVINATTPNLAAFREHGGKLIMTQGWANSLNAQTLPIEYFNSVVIGDGSLSATQSYFRLFMAPGLSHCGGGPGPNTIGGSVQPTEITPQRDVIAALQAWVENGAAPASFISTKYNNDTPSDGILLERPLCPYPQVIKYKGSGNRANASSFECANDQAAYAADRSSR